MIPSGEASLNYGLRNGVADSMELLKEPCAKARLGELGWSPGPSKRAVPHTPGCCGVKVKTYSNKMFGLLRETRSGTRNPCPLPARATASERVHKRGCGAPSWPPWIGRRASVSTCGLIVLLRGSQHTDLMKEERKKHFADAKQVCPSRPARRLPVLGP